MYVRKGEKSLNMSLGVGIDDPASGIYHDDHLHAALLALWKCNKKRSSRIRKCIGVVWGSRGTHVRKTEGRMKDAWDILYELMAPSVTSRFSSSIKPPPPPNSPRASYPPATLRWVFVVTLYSVFLKSIHEWSKIQDQRLRLPHWGYGFSIFLNLHFLKLYVYGFFEREEMFLAPLLSNAAHPETLHWFKWNCTPKCAS